ncbi:MAG: hypothetical protein GY711_12645 [bacterium]|nr:hypothetical protein [bacterium]
MSAEQLFGHGEVLAGLWRSAAAERLPHALLFRGREGIGKFLAMRRLAYGLLCAEGPAEACGRCGPCKRAVSGNHPDLFVVDAVSEGEETMGVAFIADREGRGSGPKRVSIESFLRLVAHEGGWRVVLLRGAERMNEAAQNAFLKTLEEPVSRTLIVLETHAPSALLATVRSRLVDVELAPLTLEDTRAVLGDAGVEGDEALELACWSQGAPGVALALRARAAPEIRVAIAGLLGAAGGAAEVAEELWALDGDFPGKTPAAKNRERARTILDVGLALLLDAERAVAGVAPDGLAHEAFVQALTAVPAPARERCMEEWLAARQDVELNLSPETLVERALFAAASLCSAMATRR